MKKVYHKKIRHSLFILFKIKLHKLLNWLLVPINIHAKTIWFIYIFFIICPNYSINNIPKLLLGQLNCSKLRLTPLYVFIVDIFKKRYLKIDQHLTWYFVYYVECLSSPPPFLCSQIITPFLNSMICTDHQEKGMEI